MNLGALNCANIVKRSADAENSVGAIKADGVLYGKYSGTDIDPEFNLGAVRGGLSGIFKRTADKLDDLLSDKAEITQALESALKNALNAGGQGVKRSAVSSPASPVDAALDASYKALITADDEVPITAEKLQSLVPR